MPGLWVSQRGERPSPVPQSGPNFNVYLKFSEIFSSCSNVQDEYWRLLRKVPVVDTIRVLAYISNVLASNAHDPASHRQLNEKFVETGIAKQVAEHTPGKTALSVVFHRLSNMLLIRDLVLYGTNTYSTADQPISTVGRLALCANDFLQRDAPPASGLTNLQLAAQVVGTWDVYNARDIAYALPRMYAILTEILPGNDPYITKLRARIGMDHLAIDTLTMPEFVAIVFFLFVYGNDVVTKGSERVIFDPATLFEKLPGIQRLLDRLLESRSLTVSELAQKLGCGAPNTRKQFLKDLADRDVFTTSLNVFRQQPFLRLDDGRVVILDLQFVKDLLTSGVYWQLFDRLPRQKRETFRDLWGRAFELYVADLMQTFYPAGAQILRTDITFMAGQIDALLDFGPDVFVFEAKSSLLTEAAKRHGDPSILSKDVERKFVRNERDDPKAVVQLARAARSILEETVPTTITPTRIYPVLVTDETASESFGFNAYLNEHFQRELGGLRTVRPLTVMSIDEFEELLPYVSENVFSWAELCEARFDKREVCVRSVHQAIYDLRIDRRREVKRNKYLLDRFDEIFDNIRQTYFRGRSGTAPE